MASSDVQLPHIEASSPSGTEAQPSGKAGRPPGRWYALVAELKRHEGRKMKKLTPPLSEPERDRLRDAAYWQGWTVRIRNTPIETWVWLGKPWRRRRRKVTKVVDDVK